MRCRQYGEYTQNESRGLAYEIGDRHDTELQGLVRNVRLLNFIMSVGSHRKVLKQGSYIIKMFS